MLEEALTSFTVSGAYR